MNHFRITLILLSILAVPLHALSQAQSPPWQYISQVGNNPADSNFTLYGDYKRGIYAQTGTDSNMRYFKIDTDITKATLLNQFWNLPATALVERKGFDTLGNFLILVNIKGKKEFRIYHDATLLSSTVPPFKLLSSVFHISGNILAISEEKDLYTYSLKNDWRKLPLPWEKTRFPSPLYFHTNSADVNPSALWLTTSLSGADNRGTIRLDTQKVSYEVFDKDSKGNLLPLLLFLEWDYVSHTFYQSDMEGNLYHWNGNEIVKLPFVKGGSEQAIYLPTFSKGGKGYCFYNYSKPVVEIVPDGFQEHDFKIPVNIGKALIFISIPLVECGWT